MSDRGIIFSGPMVRALLDGRKTRTRRLAVLKDGRPNPMRDWRVGDRLWARESFFVMSDDYGWEDYALRQCCAPDRTIGYRADQGDGPMVDDEDWEPPINAKRKVHGMIGDDDSEAWTLIGDIPSIYMPRWASRLTLIVEAVRVEPLQAISETDAIAEGIEPAGSGWRSYGPDGGSVAWPDLSYRTLWGSLHDKPGQRWEDNPEIVALTFRVACGNIDRIPA